MEKKSDTCGNGEIKLFGVKVAVNTMKKSVSMNGEIKLFGVKVAVNTMKKSVSMNNLSQFEQPHHQPQAHQDGEASNNSRNKIQSKDDVAAGYAFADDAVPSSRAIRFLMSTIPKNGSQIAADNFEAEPTLDSNQDTLCIISSESDKTNKKETTEKYERVEHLGNGGFGEVWRVVNKVTKECFAMKCIERGQKFEKYTAREIKIHKALCHPNIIQFMEVVLSFSYLGIVMEYAKGGDLHDEIRRNSSKKGLDENMARYYFQQLISGVSYLHSKDICHRDLKPGNILLDGSDPPCLKICDFGYSKGRLHSKPKSAVGTNEFMAPEVRKREYNDIFTQKKIEYDGKLADLWSCGAILYAMLVGKHPTGYTVSLPNYLSQSSKDLLAHMLVEDPGKRITIEDVKNHHWFKKKLKRKLPETTQVSKENPRLSLQSDEEIDKIVEEAQILLPEVAIGMEEDAESIFSISSDEEAQIRLPEDAICMEEDAEYTNLPSYFMVEDAESTNLPSYFMVEDAESTNLPPYSMDELEECFLDLPHFVL